MDRTGVTGVGGITRELNHTLQQIPESFRSVGVKTLLAFSPIFEPPLGWENGVDAITADIQDSVLKPATKQPSPPSTEGTSALARTSDSILVPSPTAEAANGLHDNPENNTIVAADQLTSESSEVLQLPVGESWNTVATQLRKLTSALTATQSQLNGGQEQEHCSVRLSDDDMDMYGFCPSTDGLVLVVCTHCSKTVRASRFCHHLENCTKVRAAAQNGVGVGMAANSETSPQNGFKKKFDATKRIKTEPDAMDHDSGLLRFDDDLYDENDFDPKARQRKRKEADSHVNEPLACKKGPGVIPVRSPKKTKKELLYDGKSTFMSSQSGGAMPLATRKKLHRNRIRGVLISLVPSVIMQYMKVNTPPSPSSVLVPTTVTLMPSTLPVTPSAPASSTPVSQSSTAASSQPSPSTPQQPPSPQNQTTKSGAANAGQAQKRSRKKPPPKATTKPNTPATQTQEPAAGVPTAASQPTITAAPIQNLKSYYMPGSGSATSATPMVTVQNVHNAQYVRPTELNRANNTGPPSPAPNGVVMLNNPPTPTSTPSTAQPIANPNTLLNTSQTIPNTIIPAAPSSTSSPLTVSSPAPLTTAPPAAAGQVFSAKGYLTISNGGIIEGRPAAANLILAQKAREQQQQQATPPQSAQVHATQPPQTVGQAQRRPVEIRPHPHHYQHMVMQPQQVTVPIGSPNVTNAH